jgi:hypothetical protein
MNKPEEVKNIPGNTGLREEQRSIPIADLLFSAGTLVAAVVTCAISVPKTPPWEGD